MGILLIMLIGVLIGRFLFPEKYKKWNEWMQVVCTVALIFAMGVMLGQRKNFLQELSAVGIKSLIFFFVPTALSILLVFVLTRRFLEQKHRKGEK